MPSSEFSLIHRHFAARAKRRPDVALGIGDDCALLAPPPGQQIATSMDLLVAGRHFLTSDDPQSIGHKALAVNLSDLAAMAATPAWVMLGLALEAPDEQWLTEFCAGFFALADRYDVQLVGGDTTHGPLTIAVQIQGFVPAGRELRRSSARPGDGIFVTGHLGDAGLGLSNNFCGVPAAWHGYLKQRLQWPTPRIEQGLALAGIASSAIDISDGLAQDLGHVLTMSGVGAEIWPAELPLSAAACACPDRDRAVAAALTAGDDYELCFTVAPERLSELKQCAAQWACGYRQIGLINAQPGLRLRGADGTAMELATKGYEHFT